MSEIIEGKKENTIFQEWSKLDIVEFNKSEIKDHAKNLYDYEMAFAKQLEKSQERGDVYISKAEFEKWEDLYRDEWILLQKNVDSANCSMADEAAAEQSMIAYSTDSELYKTIEAQAGNFYMERESALLDAINDSDNDEKDDDRNQLRAFNKSVSKHVYYKYLSKDEARALGQMYEDGRTMAHNNVIKNLNALNMLAEKYKTKRFTPRDFWTSEVQNQTPAMSKRMRYDRDIIEEYYEIAFKSEVQRAKKKLERDQMFW